MNCYERAEELLRLGYPGAAFEMYRQTGCMEKAISLAVSEAGVLSEKGLHFSAALWCRSAGMEEEFKSEIEKHKALYRMREKAPMN